MIRVSPVALAAAFGRTDIGRGRSAMRRARARRRQFEYRDVLGEIRMDGYGSTRAELLWRGSGGTRRGNDRCAMPHAWIATNF